MTSMIRQLGSHAGKKIIFGYDRYLLPELGLYREVLGKHGEVVELVDEHELHYLTSAERVCTRIQGQPGLVGVLCCGTGMGMSIAANKVRQIYAARCMTSEDARMARSINNANVLCVAAVSGLALNAQIVEDFIRTSYDGRKLDELEYIAQFELETDANGFAPSASLPACRLEKTA